MPQPPAERVPAHEPSRRGESAGFTPGADDANDRYVGNRGTGGYDVSHYDLAVRYNPANNRLWGTTTITARATQNLSRFDLDLRGLTVRAVIVDKDNRPRWQPATLAQVSDMEVARHFAPLDEGELVLT